MPTRINRHLFDVTLTPIAGTRFQPTGFPDLGAAYYKLPSATEDGDDALLVESSQSMANRLEGTAWDDINDEPVRICDGLPYVRVLDSDGKFLTSSRTESHRLASPFVRTAKLHDKTMADVMKERIGLIQDRPTPTRQIAKALFALDPFTLLHGVFFAIKEWPSQPKVQRSITSFVEATGVEQAGSGGVKRDHVRNSVQDANEGGTAEGYGSVPFHRVEWTAKDITASFVVDVAQIRSYGLPDAATQLLENIALWEIRSLLNDSLRLRTACDLEPSTNDIVDRRSGAKLPSLEELETQITSLIPKCRELTGEGAAIEVIWLPKSKGNK